MKEKDEKIPAENFEQQEEKTKQEENRQEKEAVATAVDKTADVKLLKEALADYVLARMPQEMADSFYSGKSVGQLMADWENNRLKKENRQLKAKLEKAGAKPLNLAGQGGEREKDPFALGFMDAMRNY